MRLVLYKIPAFLSRQIQHFFDVFAKFFAVLFSFQFPFPEIENGMLISCEI